MKVYEFKIKYKERPEDFVVKEVANFEEGKDNYLYLLVKYNVNLFDLVKKFDFSFAGIKDKKALTIQYVSFNNFRGEKIEIKDLNEKMKNREPWYFFKFIKKIKRKVRPGFLKGNYFFLKIKGQVEKKDKVINYFDLQRLKDNWKDGLRILEEDNLTRIRKNRIKMFKVDAFLSYLWNKSLEEFLKERKEGYFIKEDEFYFFIPYEIKEHFWWPILGYKTKFKNEEVYYENILDKFGLKLENLQNKLKKLKLKGDYRKAIVEVKNLKINKDRVSFFLQKGSYATMVLKHLQANH